MDVFEQWESSIRGYCRAWPTVFRTASNARQIDEQGRSYIDFFAGAGVLNFGHNNEVMKRAIIEFLQGDGVAHSLDMATTVKRDFIQSFVATILHPRQMNYKLQFMGPTGTNAVEAALKLARRVTGRPLVFSFTRGFHGMTLGALTCTANPYYREAAGVPLAHGLCMPFEPHGADPAAALAQLEARVEEALAQGHQPAAFIVETIQAEGGVHVASRAWLQGVRELARRTGALFIVDEIQAGCGRTGSFFSFDDMELDPDIICLAKGIGGFGTPLAMNLVKPEHDARWQPGEHTGTFRGQGISFVAGREALRYFEDDTLMRRVRRDGERIAARLRQIAGPRGGWSVRGRGMMQGLDTGQGAQARAIAARCFQEGLLIGVCGAGGRVLKVLPPLTIPAADLDEGLSILDKAVAALGEG